MAKTLPKVGPNLVQLLHKGLKKTEFQLPLTPDGYLRVSSLSELCAREEVLAVRYNVTRERVIEYYDQLTWDLGKGVHWTFQNNTLPKFGCLVGEWQCRDCGRVYGGPGNYVLRPTCCTYGNCIAPPDRQPDESSLQYVEQWFKDDVLRLSGHPDGFLRFPDVPGDGVLELKSISDRRFRDVRDVPDFGHVIQLQAYLYLTGLSWGLVLYWNKGAWKDSLAQHVIERDEHAIESIKEMIAGIRRGFQPNAPFPDRICTSADCKRAEACSLVRLCFREEL